MNIRFGKLGAGGVSLTIIVAWQALFPATRLTAQSKGADLAANGVVYYSAGPVFKPLEKAHSTTAGVFSRSTTVKGGRSPIRLTGDEAHAFRVCGVDPTRYQLYPFEDTGKSRALKFAKIDFWTGSGTYVGSRFEIPLAVRTANSGCFTMAPTQALAPGEYGFNIVDTTDLFMFGVDVGKSMISQSPQAQDAVPAQVGEVRPREVGVLYYADASEFRPLVKEVAAAGGKPDFIARVNGAHSPIRLPDGQPQAFRICGVDPTRYKLYTFESTKRERTMIMAKIGFWGSARDVLPKSEIPVVIETAEDNCYAISPKESLKAGEYGFSPVGAQDVFMFGVGNVKPMK